MTIQNSQRQRIDLVMRLFTTVSRGQRLALLAAALGVVASFFSWYGASATVGNTSYSASINGWHGWGLMAILGFVVAGALTLRVLGGRSVRELVPSLPPQVTDARVIFSAGAISALATIIFMLSEGSGAAVPGWSEGPSFGAYVGLLCGVAIAIGGYLMDQERVRRQ